MKANELRIGNYVLAEVGLPMLQIHYITASDILAYYNNAVKCLPIPITEEWLLKFGAEENNSFYINGYNFSIHLESGNLSFDHGEYTDLATIKYVHQLQNLYFALTGEELTVK